MVCGIMLRSRHHTQHDGANGKDRPQHVTTLRHQRRSMQEVDDAEPRPDPGTYQCP